MLTSGLQPGPAAAVRHDSLTRVVQHRPGDTATDPGQIIPVIPVIPGAVLANGLLLGATDQHRDM
jgi:hypothetical protein